MARPFPRAERSQIRKGPRATGAAPFFALQQDRKKLGGLRISEPERDLLEEIRDYFPKKNKEGLYVDLHEADGRPKLERLHRPPPLPAIWIGRIIKEIQARSSKEVGRTLTVPQIKRCLRAWRRFDAEIAREYDNNLKNAADQNGQ